MKKIAFRKYSEVPKPKRHDCVVAVCGFLKWTPEEFDEELVDVMNQLRFVHFEEAVDWIMNWNGLYYSCQHNAVLQIEEEMQAFRNECEVFC